MQPGQPEWQNIDEIVFSVLWSTSFLLILVAILRTKIFFGKDGVRQRGRRIKVD